MKTIILSICFVLMYSAVSFSAAPSKPKETKESPAGVETKPADVKPSEEKPKKVKRIDSYIAVFDLETTGKVDKDVIRPLTESIRREIVKSGKYEVIDRGNMDKILGEQKFQLSGCVSGQCIVEVGQLLGVGKIITGSVSMVGKTYYLSLQLVNVETGKIEDQSEDECKCEIDDLIKSSKRLVKKLMGETVEEPQATAITKTKSEYANKIPEGKDTDAKANSHTNISQEDQDRQKKAKDIAIEANSYFKQKNYSKSASLFEEALKAYPTADIYNYLAVCYLEMKEEDKALKYLKEGAEKFPKDSTLQKSLGMMYFQKGDEKEAKKVFEEALRLDPTDKQVKFLLERIK